MPKCIICTVETKYVLTEYQDVKIRPPRCLSCIIRFQPKGVSFSYQENRRYKRWMPKYLHHQWAIVAQDSIGEDWVCLHCRRTLFSPGLGIPNTISCSKGTAKTLKSIFWADVALSPVCPVCRQTAELVKDPLAYKYKRGKRFFPFICTNCG
jgi:hypothetical protein